MKDNKYVILMETSRMYLNSSAIKEIAEDLEIKVNEYLKKGYVLHGCLNQTLTHNNEYDFVVLTQAMIKND